MLDTAMENDAVDTKVTFIELQTIKKDDLFEESENCTPIELQSSFVSLVRDARKDARFRRLYRK
jgi:hypothetical protein